MGAHKSARPVVAGIPAVLPYLGKSIQRIVYDGKSVGTFRPPPFPVFLGGVHLIKRRNKFYEPGPGRTAVG